MIKARTFVAVAALAAAPLMMSASSAFAATTGHGANGSFGKGTFFDQTQTLAGEQRTFNQGGKNLGHGAAQLVSSAYIGGPQGILDIPAHVLGVPKPLMYTR
jgi:hypothetical protein